MRRERDRRAGELADALERAVAGGTISAGQAHAVLAAERGRGDGSGGRLPAAGAAGAVHAGLLWRLRDRPAQHIACLAGVIVVAASTADLTRKNGVVGLAVAGAGAVWLAADWMAGLPPRVIALTGGALTVLAGVGSIGGEWPNATPLLGLAASGAFVAVGVGTDRTPLTIVGLIGAFGYLPWTVGHFFADSLGVPLAMLLCGVVLLTITLAVLRKPARRDPALDAVPGQL